MGRYKFWISFIKELSIWVGYEKEDDCHIFLIRFLCLEIIYATKWKWYYFFK